MEIEDAIDKMSKSYLEKAVKSFTSDKYVKADEDGYRLQLLNNIDHLSKPETIEDRISDYLKESKDPYQKSMLISFILTTLLSCNEYQAELDEIIKQITKTERQFIKKSYNPDNFKHISITNLEIMKAILEAAFEDDSISEDELHLIEKVRSKLSIHRRDLYLIQGLLGNFPQKGNTIHSPEAILTGLNDLQKCGIIFYCNKLIGQPYVIPLELIPGVKNYLGIELVDEKFCDLLDTFSLPELRIISDFLEIKGAGLKDEIIDRIVATGVKPSEVLLLFDNTAITEMCRQLPEVKVSGKIEEKIQRVINYYDQLLNITVDKAKDKEEIYYSFYEQLANLDMPNLMGKKIVKNEKDAANAFELATTYLFEKKLNYPTKKQKGTDHSDGCLEFENGEFMLWDNKALMSEKYFFMNAHITQFKRYIRDAKVHGRRVNCFMVVVPDYEDSASLQAEKLKYESGSDTDVSLITASTLKWLAEEWSKEFKEKKINLQVFNKTGLISKSELKARLKLFN